MYYLSIHIVYLVFIFTVKLKQWDVVHAPKEPDVITTIIQSHNLLINLVKSLRYVKYFIILWIKFVISERIKYQFT